MAKDKRKVLLDLDLVQTLFKMKVDDNDTYSNVIRRLIKGRK